jgi:hypothetical protein
MRHKYRTYDKSKRRIEFGNTLKELNWDKKADKRVLMERVGRDALKKEAFVFDIIQMGEDFYIIMTKTDPYIHGLKNSRVMGNIFKGVKI